MSRRISETGLALIKQWEGLRLRAYRCPAGVWTIGYGHTGNVRAGMEITEEGADALLVSDLATFERAVARAVKVPLTQHQFDALVSFAFNVGVEAFRKSTLLRKLNALDYAAVPGELAKWVHAGGRKLDGLVNRRAAEAGLWVRGSHVAGRDVPAAAEPARARDVLATDTGKATAAVGLVGMVAAAKPALDVLAGLPPWLGVAVVAAAVVCALVWRLRRDA